MRGWSSSIAATRRGTSGSTCIRFIGWTQPRRELNHLRLVALRPQPVAQRETRAAGPDAAALEGYVLEVVELFVERDRAGRGDVVRDDHLVHALERVRTDQHRCCRVEIELFLHLAHDAALRRLVALQETGDQSVEAARPRTVAREHD